ncbi:nitric-oxide reductase large subunit [Suttonella sp. R2A3]|uniref:nitric-oxide reductase large subunit n=1 Tax=Suttonella sp. R2A3 TaxID=2908648 RepID=UPI001F35660B|nr:nitric-oxide reductase large subunit [Suttonella sp. R2A3]UJF24541.1 nitric-oxide reductase large subunit [Suttonella sp. R2A3]
MKSYKWLWATLVITMVITFSVLGYYGREVYREAPPIPQTFVSESGETIYSQDDIFAGQSAWQSIGGMSVGTVWGHGAYQAPDWTADWLHRELLSWMDIEAQKQFGKSYDALDEENQSLIELRAKLAFRENTYNTESGAVTLSDQRIAAIKNTAVYYDKLFGDDPEYQKSREHFAMKENTLSDADKRAQMTGFFFWSSWAASTNRPNMDVTYTNNWPHEPIIDNVPTTENIMWSVASVVLLVFGVGMVIWLWAFYSEKDPEVPTAPKQDPLSLVTLTPSQKALWKYLLVVVALFCVQVLLGGFTAHYTVEGQEFYGIPVSQWLPYSLTRTWHIQSAIFWIATAFLAAGLFLVPIINGGRDPKYQALGVNVLFVALLVVVGGSFLGQFVAIKGWMPSWLNFWFGHQGYEFVELGRFWQLALYIGLIFWLVLMLRGVWAALKAPGDNHLLILLTLSIGAIGLFYGTGLFYGEHTNLSIMEYWRWWIVHLWVEGFFEVFATVAIAFIFYTMGLVGVRSATSASILSAILFMLGGVPGTFHHLYFSGTTTPVMAVGAMFSALEVVPLVILGYEAYENWHMQSRAAWMARVKWPLMCFIAVAFWNMLGAGVFGFLINPPISLFYIQGLNTTANHAHAALFGVYGFLSLGFILLILRYIRPDMQFNEKLMKVAFWGLNIGLAMMMFMTLLPHGVIQAYAAIEHGLWYARGEEFMQSDILVTLRWIRTFGDVVFIIGAFAVTAQIVLGVMGKYRKNDTMDY